MDYNQSIVFRNIFRSEHDSDVSCFTWLESEIILINQTEAIPNRFNRAYLEVFATFVTEHKIMNLTQTDQDFAKVEASFTDNNLRRSWFDCHCVKRYRENGTIGIIRNYFKLTKDFAFGFLRNERYYGRACLSGCERKFALKTNTKNVRSGSYSDI